MNANGNPPLRSRLRSYLELFLALLLLLLLAAVSTRAEELPPPVALDEVGCGSLLLRTAAEGLYLPAPALSTEVEIDVTGFIARTRVKQRFHNPAAEWVEGIYVFPLPDKAAVDTLHLRIGERVIEGEIHERRAAQRIYEQAMNEGKKAALVEQERPNVFTTSVAQLGPDEEVAVELEYQEELRYDQGTFQLRFPMVVGPRYVPGRTPPPRGPLAAQRPFAAEGYELASDSRRVPDAARVTPPLLLRRAALGDDAAPVHPVTLRVRLDAGFPVSGLRSASHAIDVRPGGAGSYQVALAAQAWADRDFVLEWTPARGAAPQAALFTEEWGGEFYSLLLVAPPAQRSAGADERRLEREVIFVLDTSGSMSGESIAEAKAALQIALERLRPGDLFNVIEFNSHARRLWPQPLPAYLEHVEEARRWVAGLEADGGTEILAAVLLALAGQDQPAGERVRQVVFITDGCVGNEDEILREIRAGLGASRLFTIGIGSAPNAHFMRQAAASGRGSYTFIGRPEEVKTRMGELLRKLENPVLSDLALVWDEAGAAASPERVPDLYFGEPLVVVAKLANPSGATVSGVGREMWSDRVELAQARRGSGIHALWARRAIGDLEDRALDGEPEETIRAGIVELALAHHLVSRHTSLVAVDVTPTAPEGVEARTRALPVNLPAGWDPDAFGGLPQGATPARLYALVGLVLLVGSLALGLPWRRSS